MLNASYNFGLRKLPVYIPQMPVGLPDELAAKIAHFADRRARSCSASPDLKIFAFGPRPQDFFACNAPIKPLYDLGVEVMENSELDLLQLYKAVDENDPDDRARSPRTWRASWAQGNTYPDLLPKLARFELALMRFAEAEPRLAAVTASSPTSAGRRSRRRSASCRATSTRRLAARGMPVACEVDIYGALSEYIVPAGERRARRRCWTSTTPCPPT